MGELERGRGEREKEKINNNSDPLNKQKRKISNWQISADEIATTEEK